MPYLLELADIKFVFIYCILDVNISQLMCMGKVSFSEDVFHSAGYVCSREFDHVLNNRDPLYFLHTEEDVLLFNKSFIFEEAFFNDHELLFTLLK
jgi:hypothetical protein